MKNDILAMASALSDHELLTHLATLAGTEREVSAELVAHLAVLDARPAVYAGQGHASLFSYCTKTLRLSEDAACNRIETARASRRFPVIIDLLAEGALTLTSVRILRRHLTPENHQAVLARAKGRSRHEIDALVAELAPQPDTPTSVRRLPAPASSTGAMLPPAERQGQETAFAAEARLVPSFPQPSRMSRAIVQVTAPERYRVQFAIGQDAYEKLRRLQALMRREIPDGDVAEIFERALAMLLQRIERSKIGASTSAGPAISIRPRTDKVHNSATASRSIPREVKRTVWNRDGAACAFVSSNGWRCREKALLEFHHVKPYAKGGPATLANISLRCRRHNQYEADLTFGPGTHRIRPGPERSLLQPGHFRPPEGVRDAERVEGT